MDFFNADNHAHLISVTLDFQMICKELKREREKERERERVVVIAVRTVLRWA